MADLITRCEIDVLIEKLENKDGMVVLSHEKAEFKKVADDVYAFVGKLNDANALVVVTNQGVVVVDTGNNPPETCMTEVYKVPEIGIDPRGIDIDSNGIVWTALAASSHSTTSAGRAFSQGFQASASRKIEPEIRNTVYVSASR